ncbi:iron ABC transporter permease [Pseudaeromonas paramecii]|uniref:Iron ABC transporter permease n=1 Tax=Pseudaeromonas paramecii TaxID=2138166 RepID=A0ABP8Q2C0_9GAMM
MTSLSPALPLWRRVGYPLRQHWHRLRYQGQQLRQNPTSLLGLGLLLLFGYFIAVPVVSLLLDGVQVQFGDERRLGADTGAWTWHYLERTLFSAVAQSQFWTPLGHTLRIALWVVLLCLLVGGLLAWLLTRSDLPARRWLATALIVPYMLPAWTFAMAWLALFRNRSIGGQPGWLETLGVQPPDWLAYGELPITLILALNYIPFVILLLGNALRRLDAQLEDSARILGAGGLTIALRILLPLLLPALLSACLLIFAKVLGEFGVSYVLGLPVNYNVLSTSLFRSIALRQTGSAAVLAGAIMLLGLLSLGLDALLLREARKFITVGGKGSLHRRHPLGRWRWPALGLAGLLFVVSVLLPLLVLLLSTLMRVPGDFSLANFTLDFWLGRDLPFVAERHGVLLSPNLWRAAWNTLWIVGTAAIAAGLLGLLTGYVVVRSPWRPLGLLLRQLTFFPYLVPGVAFAAAYLSLFAEPRGPLPALYGTVTLLILALIADEMPYASRAGLSAMLQLGKDPEEAAQMAGAGWWQRLIRVVIPIQKGALVSGMLLPFISGINGLSLFVILAVPSTDVLTTYALRLLDYNYPQAANAVVLLVCLMALVGTLLTQRLTHTNLAEGLGH